MLNKRQFVLGALTGVVAAALVAPASVLAASPEIYANSSTGVAIHGTDPVAYFTEGKPVHGDESISAEWKGATWRFSSVENRDLFVADPERYAPQYGGYCAFALAHNALATTIPEAWTIVDDKLYLNFSTGVRSQWQTDTAGFISRADGNWPGVLD